MEQSCAHTLALTAVGNSAKSVAPLPHYITHIHESFQPFLSIAHVSMLDAEIRSPATQQPLLTCVYRLALFATFPSAAKIYLNITYR